MESLVHRLGYVALNVSDLEGAVEDTRMIAGAALVDSTPDRALMSSNARHAELILHRAAASSLHSIGLETLDPRHVDEVARRAEAAGLRVISDQPSLPVIERAVRVAFPEGHVIEVHAPMPRDRAPRYAGPGIHPRYLDHANMTAVDPETSARLMIEVLGLKLSERTEGWELAWMRAGDGRHHTRWPSPSRRSAAGCTTTAGSSRISPISSGWATCWTRRTGPSCGGRGGTARATTSSPTTSMPPAFSSRPRPR